MSSALSTETSPGVVALVAAIVVAFVCMGCGPSNRVRLMRQAASTTEEIADLLETVDDKATADAAAPKLKELVARLHKENAALESNDGIDEVLPASEENEAATAWVEQQRRLLLEEQRVAQIPEARTALGEPWQRLTGGIFDPGGPFAPGGRMDLKLPPAESRLR